MSIYYFYSPSEPIPFYYLTPTRLVGQIPPPYGTSMLPMDYLEFAIADISDGSDRGLVNAFGNAKRALHLAIDMVMHQYGLFSFYGTKNFPTKLRILDEIGLIPTKIIENLNVERNLIEHEYNTPSKKRVGEAIDVTKLLLMAVEKLTEATPHEAVVGWKEPKKHCVMQLDPIKGELTLYSLFAKGRYNKTDGLSHFIGPLRTIEGDKLLPNIKISKSPWKIIKLTNGEISDWKSIISELVNVQRKRSTYKMKIDNEDASITVPITMPLPILKGKSWGQILDEFLGAEFKKRNQHDIDSEKEQHAHEAE